MFFLVFFGFFMLVLVFPGLSLFVLVFSEASTRLSRPGRWKSLPLTETKGSGASLKCQNRLTKGQQFVTISVENFLNNFAFLSL